MISAYKHNLSEENAFDYESWIFPLAAAMNINQVIEIYWFTNWTDNSQSLNMFLFSNVVS